MRSSTVFTLRRSQIRLSSNRKQGPKEIARNLGCATQTVRNAIHAFEEKGVACLAQETSRPKTVQTQFDQAKCEALRALLHKPPHVYGKRPTCGPFSWQQKSASSKASPRSRSRIETIRQALLRLGVRWQRAKGWITSPDPEYLRGKNGATPSLSWPSATDGRLASLHEVWWSRVS